MTDDSDGFFWVNPDGSGDRIVALLAEHGQHLQELARRAQAATLAEMSRGALDLDLAHGALDAGWPKLTDWAIEEPPEPWRYWRN